MTFRSDTFASPQADTGRKLPPAAVAALVVAVASTAILLGASFFQHVVGIPPCPLCLQQRMPHYVAVPLALVLSLMAWRRAPRSLTALGFAALVLVLVTAAGIGAFHAGVEWKFWAGPSDCTGEIAPFGSAGSLLSQMQSTSVVRCDVVMFRFLGLSLAGLNVLMSTALALVALLGFSRTLRRPG
jgi:disulfide bond formation protein DsbB